MSSAAGNLAIDLSAAAAREDFTCAFDRCSPGLYRFVVVRLGSDRHLADDLMQQLWLQASEASDAVPPAELECWLRAIARNLVRTHWRKQSRRPALVPLADPALAAELAERLAREDLPERWLDRREVQDQLILAITELPEEEQALILGHYFEGQSFTQLAERRGLSERAVEGRLYRARLSLREKLKHLSP